MKIGLTEYAERNHIDPSTARKKILAGNLPAQKIGRNWCIEHDTPWIDLRRKADKEEA